MTQIDSPYEYSESVLEKTDFLKAHQGSPESIEILKDAIGREPGKLGNLRLLALHLQSAGHHMEAIQTAFDLRKALPDSPDVTYLFGCLWARQSESKDLLPVERHEFLSKARDAFQTLTEDGNSTVTLWEYLGVTLLRMGKVQQAEKVVERGLTLYPDDPHLKLLKSEFLANKGQFREAEATVLTSAIFEQDSQVHRLQLAHMELLQGNRERAMSRYEEAARIGTDQAQLSEFLKTLKEPSWLRHLYFVSEWMRKSYIFVGPGLAILSFGAAITLRDPWGIYTFGTGLLLIMACFFSIFLYRIARFFFADVPGGPKGVGVHGRPGKESACRPGALLLVPHGHLVVLFFHRIP